MKEKLKLFFSLKLLQIKQLLHHKTRTIMLLMSLTFSFTLLMVCLFTTFNFGKYAYVSTFDFVEASVQRNRNETRKDENGFDIIVTDEEFLNAMEEASKSDFIEESFFEYVTSEKQEIIYHNVSYDNFQFDLFDSDDMCLDKRSARISKVLNVKDFIYGGYPKNENEIALRESVLKKIGCKTFFY